MKRLWLKISFRFLLLMFVILVCLGLFIADIMKNTYTDMTRQQLYQEASMVAEFIDPEKLAQTVPDIQEKIKALYEKNEPRITIISSDGTVLADSEENPAQMENHAKRPEIADVLSGKSETAALTRHSESLGFNMMYVSTPIKQDNEITGVIRTAYSLERIDHMINKLWISLAAAMGIALILSGIIGGGLAKGITRPIEEIIGVSHQLTKKKYNTRVHAQTNGEIAQLADAMNVLADSLEKQMEEIQDREQQLTGVLSNMVSGLMLVNTEGRIVLVNRAMENLTGIKADNLTGEFHKNAGNNIGLSKFIDRSLTNGEVIHDDVRTYLPAERILDAHIAPYAGANDEMKGVIIVLHDITDIRHLEKMRSNFVANVSHELKTPITSLKGFAETLLDGAIDNPDVAKSFLKIMYDESERLHRLIKDILHLSKIEQQQLPFHPEQLNVIRVIDETMEMVRDELTKKQIAIILPEIKVCMMDAEKDHLKQIILNLTANAITYTPEKGKIIIDVKEKADNIELMIKDSGIGIAEKYLPRIFERFYRVDKARSRNSGGTGLGLAIVKHLVESHNGTIQVQSKEGEGTAFTLCFPKKQEI